MKDMALQDRLERLAGFGGMNRERAAELLRLLPELGRVRTDILLYLTGLKEGQTADKRSVAKPNSHLVLRVLLEALPEAAQSHDSHLGTLLRHLSGRQGGSTALCLAAMLRSYSDRLLHSAAEDDDDEVFGALEAAEDDELLTE